MAEKKSGFKKSTTPKRTKTIVRKFSHLVRTQWEGHEMFEAYLDEKDQKPHRFGKKNAQRLLAAWDSVGTEKFRKALTEVAES